MSSKAVALLVVIVAVWCHVCPLTCAESHYTNEWAVEIAGGEERAREVAKRHGYSIVASIPSLEDHYVLKRSDVPHRSKRSSHHHTKRLVEDSHVTWAEQQVARSRVKRDTEFHVRRDGSADFNDPLFQNEWYIESGAESSRTSREQGIHLDLQVKGAWKQGYTGKNVVVTVLDDGLEHNNTDIEANYDPYASTDLNDNDDDPQPRYDPTDENKHGTRCAGEVAMVANNGNCGVGIAFNSKIGGVRMLDGKVTDALEARALSFNLSHVDIMSASWGPNDDGVTVEGPGRLASKALEKGVTTGRNGKGVIYAWASGNGGRMQDNCNCDGYTSSPYTLSVSSASEHGKVPWYGELCSSTFATAYSSGMGSDHQVVSADLHNKCTTRHTGTSAAAPMAAGIFALLLEANPELTWRDVQHLVALTSKVGPLKDNDGWYKNAAGFCMNLAFGFGLLDANELVTAGHPDNWVNVPEQNKCEVSADSASNLPQMLTSGHYVEVLVDTNGCEGQDNEINFLEHVQFVFDMSYSKRGAIRVTAVSPSGTETTLMRTRDWDKSTDGFKQWPLMSVHTWGESPKGVWRFRVHDDTEGGSEKGHLKDLKLVFHGTKEAPHYLRSGPLHCDITIATGPKTTAQSSQEESGSPSSSQVNGVDMNRLLQFLLKNKGQGLGSYAQRQPEKFPYL